MFYISRRTRHKVAGFGCSPTSAIITSKSFADILIKKNKFVCAASGNIRGRNVKDTQRITKCIFGAGG